jgi:hypothetical protein
MWQRYIFGVHWKHQGKLYYDEFPADSKDDATEYFNHHKRDDVNMVRVERVRPDDNGVREYAQSSVSPFRPLTARRRMDKDEDVR